MKFENLGRKCLVLTAVAAVALACGWSASGLTAGVVLAIALSAAVVVPVFTERGPDCSLRLRRR